MDSRESIEYFVDAFYAKVTAHSATRSMIERHTTVEKQRGPLKRYIETIFSGRVDDAWGGEASPLPGIGAASAFVSGMTRYFQAVHRDEPMLVCGRGQNSSQSIEITFTP